MQLRDYQEKLCTTLAQKLASGKRKIIAQLATGGGKTICFSAIASRFTLKSKKSVLILVHRKELISKHTFLIGIDLYSLGNPYLDLYLYETLNSMQYSAPPISLII